MSAQILAEVIRLFREWRFATSATTRSKAREAFVRYMCTVAGIE